MLTIDEIHQGDCLELMTEIDDESIDAIIADLPYGITSCDWDTPLDFDKLWAQYKRIIKPRGAIVLTASQPFTTDLINSNRAWFKYEWIWEKTKGVDFQHAKNKPLQMHENILLFSTGTISHKTQSGVENINRINYNPQNLKEINKKWSRPKISGGKHNLDRPSDKLERVLMFENYPRSVIQFSNPNNKSTHPTQKPVALFEYLIRTYTDKGDLILDNCLGSGTTAVAALNNDRHFIGIELSEEYCEVARRRIERETRQQRLF